FVPIVRLLCCIKCYQRSGIKPRQVHKDLYFEYALTGGDDARYTFNDEETLTEFASASQRLNLGLHE
ncbi:hypothetical protein, partial [Epibacterium ulvae]|uniref:hypothetical protein n=1 Tax=Epibacterium ulvae TaxID=1156985 RepID=UPI002493AA7B